MSFCAKTYCEIYRHKRYCRKAEEKEHNGVCDCRHAVYGCEAGKVCQRVKTCSAAPAAAVIEYQMLEKMMRKRGDE